MERSTISIVFGVAVMLMMLVGDSDAVKCYECTTFQSSSSSCDSPSKSTGTCSGTTCVKMTGSYQGTSGTYRSCYSGSYDSKCVDYNEGGYSGKACYCSSDLCNTGSTVFTGRLIVGLLAATVSLISCRSLLP